MSGIYISKKARQGAAHRRAPEKMPRWIVFVLVIGTIVLLTAAGVATAAIILHGRGLLAAPAATDRGLQVSDIRLSRPLQPGGSADLLFSVRNPNPFGARIDQVALIGGLRKANPAGCTSRIGGPLIRSGGYRLPLTEQVLIGAGLKRNVVVHAAFMLAAAAKTGCGFLVQIDVRATQLLPTISPTTTKPSESPTTPTAEPSTTSVTTGPTTPSTTDPTTTEPSTTPPDTTPPDVDCDPAAEVCPPTVSLPHQGSPPVLF